MVIAGGFGIQLLFVGLVMLVLRMQANAQTGETITTAGEVISEFTRSVDVFNFVIVSSFAGYAGSLFVILKLVQKHHLSLEAARVAFMADAAAARAASERETATLTGLVMKSQENTLKAIDALVKVSDITDGARQELANTGGLVQAFMDSALPAITNAYRESDLAKHDRDLVVSGFRQSIDTFAPKFENTAAKIDELLHALQNRSRILTKEGD